MKRVYSLHYRRQPENSLPTLSFVVNVLLAMSFVVYMMVALLVVLEMLTPATVVSRSPFTSPADLHVHSALMQPDDGLSATVRLIDQ